MKNSDKAAIALEKIEKTKGFKQLIIGESLLG
jgi:hypothetical protein